MMMSELENLDKACEMTVFPLMPPASFSSTSLLPSPQNALGLTTRKPQGWP